MTILAASKQWLVGRKFDDPKLEADFQREFREASLPVLQVVGAIVFVAFLVTFSKSPEPGFSTEAPSQWIRKASMLVGLACLIFPFFFRAFWLKHYLSIAILVGLICSSVPYSKLIDSWLWSGSIVFPLSTPAILVGLGFLLRINRVALLLVFSYSIGTLAFLSSIGVLSDGKFFPWHFYIWILAALVIVAAFNAESRERSLYMQRIRAREAEQRADELTRSKSYFFSAASHDLRQPLAAMSLWAEKIGRARTLDETQTSANALVPAVKAMREMFDALLLSANLDSGRYEPFIDRFDLSAVVHEIANEYRDRCELKGLSLEVTGGETTFVRSDPLYVSRLIRNLLHNAVNYTDAGQITLGMRPSNPSSIEVFVKDSGPGISLEQQAKIFDEYYQVPGSQNGKTKGLGLGLSIVKRISDALGLDLTVDSKLGEGSKFSIFIPSDRFPK